MGQVVSISDHEGLVNTVSSPYGFTCGSCGQFVPNNIFHLCGKSIHLSPQPPAYPATVSYGPCLGFTDHDFVSTNKYAICNRCEKVILFDSWLDKLIIWCRSKLRL